MADQPRSAIHGFVVTDPTLTTTRSTGTPRVSMRAGRRHYQRQPDGTYTQNEPTYFNVVAYGPTAQRIARMFVAGDQFLADADLETYPVTNPDGTTTQREEYVAHRIGHDTTCTNYTVDRSPRQPPPGQAVRPFGHTTQPAPATTPVTTPPVPAPAVARAAAIGM
jgi:single-stranded DNA-binding protein